MMLRLAILSLLAGGRLCLADDSLPLTLTAGVDKPQVTVGDVITYTVQVTCPPGTTVAAPDAAKSLAPFEVRSEKTTQETREDKLVVTLRQEVVAFEVGQRPLGLALQCTLPGQTARHTLHAPPVKVTVQSVLPPGAQDIKDIREPVPVKMGTGEWLAAGLVALVGLLLLAAVVWLLVRRHLRRRRRAAGPVLVGPHERALAELDALRASNLLRRGELKQYYTRLSEVLREYLEARFEVPAMEQTTWMIRLHLERLPEAREWVQDFSDLLRRSDLVKFARQPVMAAEADEDLERARRVVTASRLIPQPVPAQAPVAPVTT